jgi:predicted phage-related endonuclease
MLTPNQLAARKGKLTASRVACLMTADAQAIMALWREMTDDPTFIPDDLRAVWPVRLGECTEQLQLDWFEMQNDLPVTLRGEVVIHKRLSWVAATLDGWCEGLSCPIECKHVGGREPLEVIIDRYQPQMQWQMEVTGAKQCALSVIVGTNAPIVEFIERDDEYIAEMLKRGAQFMDCVAKRRPPVALEPVAPPADASKVYDMAGNNAWANYAGIWLSTKKAADECKDAEKILKAAVPADAKKCHGHNVQITRDRAGRLSLREIAP